MHDDGWVETVGRVGLHDHGRPSISTDVLGVEEPPDAEVVYTSVPIGVVEGPLAV